MPSGERDFGPKHHKKGQGPRKGAATLAELYGDFCAAYTIQVKGQEIGKSEWRKWWKFRLQVSSDRTVDRRTKHLEDMGLVERRADPHRVYARALPEIVAAKKADELGLPEDTWRERTREYEEDTGEEVLPGPLLRNHLKLTRGVTGKRGMQEALNELERSDLIEPLDSQKTYFAILDPGGLADWTGSPDEWRYWKLIEVAANGGVPDWTP